MLDLSSNPLTSKEPTRGGSGSGGGDGRDGGELGGGGGGGGDPASDLNDANRALSTEGVDTLKDLFATEDLALEIVRLRNCQLCGPSEHAKSRL